MDRVYDLAYHFNQEPVPCPYDHEHSFLECFKLALDEIRVGIKEVVDERRD